MIAVVIQPIEPGAAAPEASSSGPAAPSPAPIEPTTAGPEAAKPSPAPAAEPRYLPLVHVGDTFVPVASPHSLYTEHADALDACIARLTSDFDHVYTLARTLHALCEHPNFDFMEDGIDSKAIRTAARRLSAAMAPFEFNLATLRDQPSQGTTINIDGCIWIASHQGIIKPDDSFTDTDSPTDASLQGLLVQLTQLIERRRKQKLTAPELREIEAAFANLREERSEADEPEAITAEFHPQTPDNPEEAEP